MAMTREEMDALDAQQRQLYAEHLDLDDVTVICLPVDDIDDSQYFDDDVIGECQRCECKIRYRPYVPKHWVKLCIDCVGAKLIEEDFR